MAAFPLVNIEAMLQLAMVAMIRPGAAFIAAPVFGSNSVPVQLRLVIALAIGLPAIGMSAISLPPQGLVSWQGFLLVGGEVIIGLAIGFSLQISVAAALIAGETISNTMGLGFAVMVDPLSGQMNSAIGQFLSMLTTAILLATDGHLLLADALAQSYVAIPVGQSLPTADLVHVVTGFGSAMFQGGIAIAAPVCFSLILVQMVMGVIGRSAPTMNLFSVGIPATLLFGAIMLATALPVMAEAITHVMTVATTQMRQMVGY